MIGKRGIFLKQHVKKGDMVIVIAGDDKGKKGKILKVFPGEQRVLVEGLNIVKRHVKARPPKIPQGGILEESAPMHISNVKLVKTES